MPSASSKLKRLLLSLAGLPCWYVSRGGAAGSSFQMALGEKVPRAIPVKNRVHPEEYRRNEGQANLLVWCSWRLNGPEGPVASSASPSKSLERSLDQLIGSTLLSCTPVTEAWDFIAKFDND